ncbi:MAG: tetratricopeptide repeat protein [Saprospiraceae bacterium]
MAISDNIKLANDGNKLAQFTLGFLFSNGNSLIDTSKAIYWYEKATEQGDEKSMFNFGVIYNEMTGTQENKEKSFYWFNKSAELGNYKS